MKGGAQGSSDTSPKPIEVPVYVEKIIEVPRFVHRDVVVEKITLMPKDVVYERPRYIEKQYEKPVLVEKAYTIPRLVEVEYKVPKFAYVESEYRLTDQDVQRLKQAAALLPQVLQLLEQIVKWTPQEQPFEVKVPKLVQHEIHVDRAVLHDVNVERPVFVDVVYKKPIIREEVLRVRKLVVPGKNGKAEQLVGYAPVD